MTAKQVPPELMAKFRKTHAELRPILDAEMHVVRANWKAEIEGLTDVVKRHDAEIDDYISVHGPMSRAEVLEKALSDLLSKV